MSLRDLLADVVRVFLADAARGRMRCVLLESDSLLVLADPSQLRQVAWNILRNAADATPEGGEIVVEPLDERPVRVGFRVTDSGPGIPADAHAQIFEPFFTTKKDGTGLGLAMVHRILEGHGGSVEVRNAAAGGTVVTVWLPLQTDPPGQNA